MTTDFAATKRHVPPARGRDLSGRQLAGPAAARPPPPAWRRPCTEEWGEMLITGWNKAGWMDAARRAWATASPG